MNFGPVTAKFKRLVNQQFSYVRLAASLLDTAVISTEFCGAISTQLSFTYSLGGVTAMPRGLHARLCHAFLVSSDLSVLLIGGSHVELGRFTRHDPVRHGFDQSQRTLSVA